MAFPRVQFRNFTRELEVGTRGLSGPAASDRLAAMARAHIADVGRQQAARSGGMVPDHTITVDGRAGATREQVRPDGVILIAWHYLTEAVIRTVTYLKENGRERKGAWKASITTFVDDTAVPRTARLPAGATEAVVGGEDRRAPTAEARAQRRPERLVERREAAALGQARTVRAGWR
jgi:hypothetical protein